MAVKLPDIMSEGLPQGSGQWGWGIQNCPPPPSGEGGTFWGETVYTGGNQGGGTSLTWAWKSKIYKYVNDTQMIKIDLRQDFLSTFIPFLYYASEIEI